MPEGIFSANAARATTFTGAPRRAATGQAYLIFAVLCAGFLASQFYNFPCYPDLVPDINDLIAADENAQPSGKYNIFNDVTEWTTNVGYPGYANPAIDEIFNTWVISTLFADVAKGRMSPEEAAKEGDKITRQIFVYEEPTREQPFASVLDLRRADAIFLPGGYPELEAGLLAANRDFLRAYELGYPDPWLHERVREILG